jgi:putative ABC transport system substrate-binding protein
MTARGQQPAVPMIGFLHIGEFDTAGDWASGFRQGLKDTGFVEGQNVVVEYRWANDNNGQLPTLVADLIRRKVNVIVAAGGSGPAVAAKAATSTIPIVFAFGADPVKFGLLDSLNRPGGNVTGVTFLTTELAASGSICCA